MCLHEPELRLLEPFDEAVQGHYSPPAVITSSLSPLLLSVINIFVLLSSFLLVHVFLLYGVLPRVTLRGRIGMSAWGQTFFSPISGVPFITKYRCCYSE